MTAGQELDTALAAEHAAVYAYGIIGARTTGNLRVIATAAFNAHRARRDRLRTLIISGGGTPAEPTATYDLPVIPSTPAQAVELAVLVEEGVTTAYLELTASTDAAVRQMSALAMQECATRSYGLRPEIAAFPGMPPAPKPVLPATAPSSSAAPSQ
ncbi:ferritin-like domain-containing protein [Streptosporangium subroseum]|uniref:ferritin-like domain-containing protein n=1 Tax=Streptosporangium subroseum TaxID=106412 RepID=UPI0030869B17|nr:ferritin-like domain-containing protein [Streptosporangium subroseum]